VSSGYLLLSADVKADVINTGVLGYNLCEIVPVYSHVGRNREKSFRNNTSVRA
jgi:hypothetical protein